MRPGDVLGDLGHPLLQQGHRLGGEEADGGGELRRVRDDVAGLRGFELSDRDDDGIEDVEGPTGHRIQGQHHLGERRHGVAGRLRLAAVSARPVDGQVEVGEAGHERPALRREATSNVGFDVDAVGRDDRDSGGLEHALGDHRLGPAFDLLGGLEHEDDRPGDLLAVSREQACGTDESRRVQVVTARVHIPVLRGEVEAGVLDDRQRVHVPAQQHRGPGFPALEDGHHRGERLPRGDLKSQPGELIEHRPLREGKVESQFGVRVQLPSQGNEIAEVALSFGAEIWGGHGAPHRVGGVRFGSTGSGRLLLPIYALRWSTHPCCRSARASNVDYPRHSTRRPSVRIIITQNITLDGRVEMLDDWFDPQAQDEELSAELMRQSANEDVLLLGRQTFEDFRGYWPNATDDTTGVADHLNQVDKRVVSSTLTEPGWQNTQIISSDPLRAVADLREAPGRDVIVTGSITLAHELIAEGLVDEYRMFTYPVWQGRGRGYFHDGAHSARPPRLKLIDAKSFPSGITYSAYEPSA